MFRNCTSLTMAPKLPATTLTYYCYNYMFYGCSKLEIAPSLPATTLSTQSYQMMFGSCPKLRQMRVGLRSNSYWYWPSYMNCWHHGLSNRNGVFYKPNVLTINRSGSSCDYVPPGWAINNESTQNFDEYEV